MVENYRANAVIPIVTRRDKLGGLVLFPQADELPTEEQLHCGRFLAEMLAAQMTR